MAERILRLATTAAVLALVARHLQPEGFGQLSFAISFSGVFTPLAFAGLEGLLVSELVRRPDRAASLLGTACVLRLGAGLLSAAFCLLLAFGVSALRPEAWIIFPLSLGLLWQSIEVIDVWFQRHLKSRRTASVRLAAVMIGAGIKVWLVWRGAPVPWFAWAVLGDVVLFELGLLLAYTHSPERPSRWSFDSALAKELLVRGLPLAVAGVLTALQGRLDQFAVKALLTETETGAYFAAVRLAELPLFAFAAIGLSAFPALASSRTNGAAAFTVQAQRLFDLLTAGAWAAAIAITVLGPWIVPWLLGPAYRSAVPVLIVLAWGLVPLAGNLARQQCILANLPTWLQMAAALAGIVAQVLLTAWLVPRYGTLGAAFASIGAAFAGGWLVSFLLPGLRPTAGWQGRALLIPFQPQRWNEALALLK